MKQLALEVVARTLDPAQISLLAEEFDRADNNNNGEVRVYAGSSHGRQLRLPDRAALFLPLVLTAECFFGRLKTPPPAASVCHRARHARRSNEDSTSPLAFVPVVVVVVIVTALLGPAKRYPTTQRSPPVRPCAFPTTTHRRIRCPCRSSSGGWRPTARPEAWPTMKWRRSLTLWTSTTPVRCGCRALDINNFNGHAMSPFSR